MTENMAEIMRLKTAVEARFTDQLDLSVIENNEYTVEVKPKNLISVCQVLRDDPNFSFEMLIDICGMDYLEYGLSEWETSETATLTGFSRGVERENLENSENKENRKYVWKKPRFAAVYHLLSLSKNQRIRLRCFVEGEPPIIPSVIHVWNSANWYEREAFDLFGILFDGHPDLRRILTDYGFIGHPFRKDFPLIGTVEMRYSAKEKRVIYEPVQIQPRTLVPKTIPIDNRYAGKEYDAGKEHA